MFTAFDYAVMAGVGLWALRGSWRGGLSEIFRLTGWIAAFFIACRFVGYVVPSIPSPWPGGALTQWLLAFALVAIGAVLVASVLSALLSSIVQTTGLRGV